MGEIRDYNISADSNTQTPPDGAPEGMSPSSVNNTMREAYARIKRFYNDTNGANTTAGSGNTYTLSASRTVASYAAGDMYVAKFNHSNTGNSTINIDSVGAKGIVTPSLNELPVNSIRAGGVYAIVYEASADKFILLDSHPSENQINLKNPDSEDTAGGRESQIVFKGLQSGSEESTLGRIQASHEGTSDDQKGQLIFSTNDGSDSDAPTTALTIGSDQVVTFAKNPSGVTAGIVKNYILNPEFDVAQRGKTINATTPISGANNSESYCLDQWIIVSDGNDIIDVAQSTTAPTGSTHSAQLSIETQNKKAGLLQWTEASQGQNLIGKTVTLSFQAKSSDAAIDDFRAVVLSWDGTADAPDKTIISSFGSEGSNPTYNTNVTAENTSANLNLSTSFQKFSITCDIDTSGAKNVGVYIFSNTTTGLSTGENIFISQVQLEVGSTANDFVHEDYSTTWLKCARYFRGWVETSDDSANEGPIANGHNMSGSGARMHLNNPVPFRATPTFDQSSTFVVSNGTGDITGFTSIDTIGPGTNGLYFVVTYSSSIPNGGQVIIFLKEGQGGTARWFVSCELGV
ncbi:sugar binding protein [uncultured Mediterranean phage uvMED]|nr:sugar binding protein [uncultured Mediterranean phage uvMED]BAQ88913.1 sugar binding protein [uncultured Mediterranean phage uvMED]BAQ88962.1 sugar binding protein [uncultured Mediterranean phage uvMED]